MAEHPPTQSDFTQWVRHAGYELDMLMHDQVAMARAVKEFAEQYHRPTNSELLDQASAAGVRQIGGTDLSLAIFWGQAASLAELFDLCPQYDMFAMLMGGPRRDKVRLSRYLERHPHHE